MGTGLRGLQDASHVVHMCLEGCYICENVVEGILKSCLMDFFLVGEISRNLRLWLLYRHTVEP